jgi:hypothetical protein
MIGRQMSACLNCGIARRQQTKTNLWAIVVVMAKLGGYSRNDQILSQAYLLAQISGRQQVKTGTSHRRGGGEFERPRNRPSDGTFTDSTLFSFDSPNLARGRSFSFFFTDQVHRGRALRQVGVPFSLCFVKNSVIALDALLSVDFHNRLDQIGPPLLSSAGE